MRRQCVPQILGDQRNTAQLVKKVGTNAEDCTRRLHKSREVHDDSEVAGDGGERLGDEARL